MPQNKAQLFAQNSKLKKSSGKRTFNFGIPAFSSTTGLKTCPKAGACAVGCYATMGAYRFSNVVKAYEARLTATLAPDFVERAVAELKKRGIERVRIHDSGDFYSINYILRWRDIMHALPHVEFYAYTKQVRLFKALQTRHVLPKNFVLIYSYGGTEDKHIDRKVDRHSWVFPSVEALKADGYADASADDAVAVGTNLRVGLVYHGNKNLENTAWAKVKR